jgi:phosphate transport system permease protein
MNDMAATAAAPVRRAPTDWNADAMQQRIRRRYSAERRFRWIGLGAILLSAAFLAFLLISMLGNGIRGFTQTEVRLDIDFPKSQLFLDPATLKGFGAEAALAGADIDSVVRTAATARYGAAGAEVLSESAWLRVRSAIRENPEILTRQHGIWLPASSPLDQAVKSEGAPAAERIYQQLEARDAVRTGFNWNFLTGADATDPAAVGIWGAFKGSMLTMLVTLALAFPIGVLSAVYLEEYAPRTAGPTSSRCRSTISRPCPRSSSACSVSPSFSTSCTCRARRRWSAVLRSR